MELIYHKLPIANFCPFLPLGMQKKMFYARKRILVMLLTNENSMSQCQCVSVCLMRPLSAGRQQAELSRSFKRRQRRKKQLERRRRADADGSPDQQGPSGAAVGPRQSAPSPAAREASAAASHKSGNGESVNNCRPGEEEVGSVVGSAAGASPETAGESAENGLCERQDTSTQLSGRCPAHIAETADRTKSATTKRKKRKSTGPSTSAQHEPALCPTLRPGSVPSPSQCPESSPSPGQRPETVLSPAQRSEPAPSSTQRSEPAPSPSQRLEAAPSPGQRSEAAPCPADRSARAGKRVSDSAVVSGDEHGKTSPTVTSAEGLLISIQTLRTVLGELRTRLLAGPPLPLVPQTAPATSPPPTSESPDTATRGGQSGPAVSVMVPPADPAAGSEPPQKTKEQIRAERKAKAEAAKLAKAAKASQKKVGVWPDANDRTVLCLWAGYSAVNVQFW